MTDGPLQPTGDDDPYLGWGGWSDRKSMTVLQSDRQAMVSYPSQSGGKPFRAIFRQKPNPIGFHAKLPGDRRA